MNDTEIRPSLPLRQIDALVKMMVGNTQKKIGVLNANEMRVLHHLERYWFVTKVLSDKNVSSVLDVGCGRAIGMRALLHGLPQLNDFVGIEMEPDVYNEVLNECERPGAMVTVVNSRFERINLGRQFDIVICFEVLGDENITDDAGLIKKLQGLSSRFIFLSSPNYRNPDHVKKSYVARAYSHQQFFDITKTNLPECKVRHYGQLHPVNRGRLEGGGVIEWTEAADFNICLAEKQ